MLNPATGGVDVYYFPIKARTAGSAKASARLVRFPREFPDRHTKTSLGGADHSPSYI